MMIDDLPLSKALTKMLKQDIHVTKVVSNIHV